MFTPTIYIPDCNLEAELISLDELKLHHLKNVLRIKNEDNVNIFSVKVLFPEIKRFERFTFQQKDKKIINTQLRTLKINFIS